MNDKRALRQTEEAGKRAVRLSIYVFVAFCIILLRLWYLQILKTDDFFSLSENNRLRMVPMAAPRGTILDRNGKLLVGNQPSFTVAVIRQEVTDRDQLLQRLSRYLDIDLTDVRERWDKSRGPSRYYPLIVASGITRDQLEFLEENRLRLPGVDVEMKPIREFATGFSGVHLLGYIGQISDEELDREGFEGYNPGDYIGKSGIEKAYEKDLHGEDGGRQLEVDARGRILRTVSESAPVIGKSLMLTIDLDLQKAAEEALGDRAGAAVAIDPNSGEILAYASSPSFDPAHFTGKMTREQWQAYLDDKRHPLENKAVRGQYPPGSTFKIITALAGLEAGLINENTTVQCNGSYKLGDRVFQCWDKKGHGPVNLKKALKQSCDVYFYQLAERLGVDRIAATARKFGLGAPTGIGLDNEKPGLIPTTGWKEKKYGKKWLLGETLSVGIGQGYVLATPLQLASMTATLANGGTVYRPFIVRKIMDVDGHTVREFAPQVVGSAGLRPEDVRLVEDGLQAVVNEAGGTGRAARLAEVKVAGKTGTSQVVKLRKGPIPYEYRDHALFVAFAPLDKPQIAVAVVVEHGEHGGGAAAPVAGSILRAYFEGKGVISKPRAAGDEEEEGGDEQDETSE